MFEYGGLLKGLAAGYAVVWLILMMVAVVFLAAYIVSMAAIFNKAGMSMWKSVIPVYNIYIFFKIGKKEQLFKWCAVSLAVYLVCTVILSVKTSMSPFYEDSFFDDYLYMYSGDFDAVAMLCAILNSLSYIGLLIFLIIMKYNLAKSFGHRGGFTVGLVLLEPVFYMILGFGSDKYVYGQNEPAPEPAPESLTAKSVGYIRCIAGERAGASIIMEEGELIKIGRDPKAATLIVDENNGKSKISRLHCEVEYDTYQSVYYVTDRSKNGVSLEDGTKLIAGVRTPVERGTKIILPKGNVFLLA